MGFVSSSWKPKELSEDSCTINVFDPISKPFITHIANTMYHGNDHVLEASKQRKAKQSSSSTGRKPDRAIDVIVDGSSYNILIVEIKTGGKSKGRPDLVKLGTMMKDNVDFVLEQGHSRKEYYSIGILQEGAKTSVYTMSCPVDFFYVMHLVEQFQLPMDINEMGLLSQAVKGFELCRSLMLNSISILRSTPDNESFEYRLTSTSPKHHADYYS